MKLLKATILLFGTTCFAQLNSNIVGSRNNNALFEITNSPTAASFRTFGEFPPSNFIGVTDISIPLYDFEIRNTNYAVALRYHNGMGNIVNSVPGSVGLGWHLTSGGTITLVDSRKMDINTGELMSTSFDVTKADNWASLDHLKSFFGDPKYPYSAKSVINNGYKSLQKNVFAFNFNNMSGEIYFDHDEQPKIRSKDNIYFNVKFELVSSSSDGPVIDLPPMNQYFNRDAVAKTYPYINILPKHLLNPGAATLDSDDVYRITLTDANGVQYIFGGDKNAIELSRFGHSGYEGDVPNTDKRVYPLTWHITEIIYPNREYVSFQYRRGEVLYNGFTETNLKKNLHTRPSHSQPRDHYGNMFTFGNIVTSTLINPVYLEKITTPREKIVYKYSKSKQLETHLKDLVGFNNCVYRENPRGFTCDFDFFTSLYLPLKNSFFYRFVDDINYTDFTKFKQLPDQLDKIEVYNNVGTKIREIDFNFTSNYQERLKLLDIEIKSLESSSYVSEKYKFNYNTNKLPNYDSYRVDNQGFYNGVYHQSQSNNALDVSDKNSIWTNFWSSTQERNNYIASRDSKTTFNTNEILTSITYPTGGVTKFEYESNMYGGVAKNYPFVVQSNTAKITGGVRIKGIKSYDEAGKLQKSKSFMYVKNYNQGGTSSSGILTHEPTYFDIIRTDNFYLGEKSDAVKIYEIDYLNWSTSDIYPANRLRGNHITYSEVTEIDDMDGSFVTYKYKNFDNGYQDQPILQWLANHDNILKDEFGQNKDFWKKYDVISMDLERGQLLNKSYFNQDKKKVKEFNFEYNSDPERFNNHIREINRYENKLFYAATRDMLSWTYITSKIYTYTPYLVKASEIDYFGSNSIVKNETSYRYHEKYKMIREKEEKIGDKVYKTVYKYPFDYIYPSVYINMEKKNMISPVILEEKYIDGEKVFSQKNNYDTWFLSIGWRDLVLNSTSEPEVTPQNNVSNPPIFLLGNLPVLRNIEKQNKQGDWEKEVDFLSYDLKYNLVSSKDKTGFETSYIWGYNRSLPVWVIANAPYYSISDLLGDKISKIGSDLVPLEADVQAVNTLLKQSSDLKEAVINHYLYDPIKGLIYKENERGGKEYYEYDGFGRLKKVQDGKKNTLIEYEYNYKQ
ncbi:sugar-binding protein [Myroides odoratus]|uniref:sugar-binding protein n=1 Tax=Myroides odoratus TaxID=256 RepID=UPI002168CFD3|nr:sugar-binding protein [Myroides odoratus]MCS4238489.1 virulence-associated protein VapD [Myroides odoratus]